MPPRGLPKRFHKQYRKLKKKYGTKKAAKMSWAWAEHTVQGVRKYKKNLPRHVPKGRR